MGSQIQNFFKAKKACWFVYSLFGLLTILAIFETFWLYLFVNLLTVLSLKQPGQAHCALAIKRGKTENVVKVVDKNS